MMLLKFHVFAVYNFLMVQRLEKVNLWKKYITSLLPHTSIEVAHYIDMMHVAINPMFSISNTDIPIWYNICELSHIQNEWFVYVLKIYFSLLFVVVIYPHITLQYSKIIHLESMNSVKTLASLCAIGFEIPYVCSEKCIFAWHWTNST